MIGPELMQRQPPQVRMILWANPEEIMNFTLKETGAVPIACQRWKSFLSCFQRHGSNDECVAAQYFENVANCESTRPFTSVFCNHQGELSMKLVFHVVSEVHKRCGGQAHFMDNTHSETPKIFKMPPRNSRTPSGSVRARASSRTIFKATGASGRRTGSLRSQGSVGEP